MIRHKSSMVVQFIDVKLVVIGLIIFIFWGVSAYAKPQQPQHELTIDDIVAKMKIQLELTDKQAQEVKPIIENYINQEKKLKLEENKELGKVLTGQQLFTWNFLQNEPSHEKKKHSSLF